MKAFEVDQHLQCIPDKGSQILLFSECQNVLNKTLDNNCKEHGNISNSQTQSDKLLISINRLQRAIQFSKFCEHKIFGKTNSTHEN